MIAPAAAAPITKPTFSCPCEASSAAAISVVSPGSGTPIDSIPITRPTRRYAAIAAPPVGIVMASACSVSSPMPPSWHRGATNYLTQELFRGNFRVCPVERLRHVLQRRGDLGRDHPERVARALGQLGQHLQVLVGQQFRVRVVAVDRLEDGVDRLGLALGAQDRGLPVTLRGQDPRLPLTLGGQD